MKQKLFKILSNVLLVLLLGAVGVFAAPRLFGIQMYGVLTGSMEPAYSVGDLIYVVPTDQEDIEVGDVISFLLNESGTVVTHRVVEIDEDNNYFYTQGDANDTQDGNPVHYNNIIGVVRFSIPLAGYATVYMSTTSGKILTFTVVLAAMILVVLFELLSRVDDAESEAQETQASVEGLTAQAAQANAKAQVEAQMNGMQASLDAARAKAQASYVQANIAQVDNVQENVESLATQATQATPVTPQPTQVAQPTAQPTQVTVEGWASQAAPVTPTAQAAPVTPAAQVAPVTPQATQAAFEGLATQATMQPTQPAQVTQAAQAAVGGFATQETQADVETRARVERLATQVERLATQVEMLATQETQADVEARAEVERLAARVERLAAKVERLAIRDIRETNVQNTANAGNIANVERTAGAASTASAGRTVRAGRTASTGRMTSRTASASRAVSAGHTANTIHTVKVNGITYVTISPRTPATSRRLAR